MGIPYLELPLHLGRHGYLVYGEIAGFAYYLLRFPLARAISWSWLHIEYLKITVKNKNK